MEKVLGSFDNDCMPKESNEEIGEENPLVVKDS